MLLWISLEKAQDNNARHKNVWAINFIDHDDDLLQFNNAKL